MRGDRRGEDQSRRGSFDSIFTHQGGHFSQICMTTSAPRYTAVTHHPGCTRPCPIDLRFLITS
jgi:hypothetical protein